MIYDSSEQVSFFQALFCGSKATIRKKRNKIKKETKEARWLFQKPGGSPIYDPITVRFIIAKFAITASRLYAVTEHRLQSE